jgi:hypothetical protein
MIRRRKSKQWMLQPCACMHSIVGWNSRILLFLSNLRNPSLVCPASTVQLTSSSSLEVFNDHRYRNHSSAPNQPTRINHLSAYGSGLDQEKLDMAGGKHLILQLLVVCLAAPVVRSGWLQGTATFYGGSDGSGTMGKYVVKLDEHRSWLACVCTS